MNHKFFSIKELKHSLENQPNCVNEPLVELTLDMLKNIIVAKKPVPKKGPASFSYKNINLN